MKYNFFEKNSDRRREMEESYVHTRKYTCMRLLLGDEKTYHDEYLNNHNDNK